MIRRPPRSTQGVSSAASDVYKRQVFVGLPPAIYQFVSGVTLLILMAVLTVAIALVDGATFRASWTIFCVAGLAYFAAMSLYFNEGTWIYLPVFVFLAWAASKLGAAVGSKAGKS